MSRLPYDSKSFAAAAVDTGEVLTALEYAAFVAARIPEKAIVCEFATIARTMRDFSKKAAKIRSEADALIKSHPELIAKIAAEWVDHGKRKKK